MSTKIAINGFGRIGRLVTRILLTKHPDVELVAINDLTPNETMTHLFKYDSVFGKFEKEVNFSEDSMLIGGKKIKLLSEKDPKSLPWKDMEVDVVLECTGVFRDYDGAHQHIEAGAKKVVLSAPGKGEREIPLFVPGVNDDKLTDNMEIVSMASCTTNCLAPILKVLEEKFGVENSFITTIHSYTSSQNIVDSFHKDLRRARAAGVSIIPTTTGAATAAAKTVESMKGKIDGMAVRVPTPTVSLVDLVAVLSKEVSKDDLHQAFKDAEAGELKDILGTSDEPLVSVDYRGESRSSVVDLGSTMVNKNLIKIIAWYDNEWGYSSRLAEFAKKVA